MHHDHLRTHGTRTISAAHAGAAGEPPRGSELETRRVRVATLYPEPRPLAFLTGLVHIVGQHSVGRCESPVSVSLIEGNSMQPNVESNSRNHSTADTSGATTGPGTGVKGRSFAGAPIHSALIVGTGLMGTSAALALRHRGIVVSLFDIDHAALTVACELGAGDEWVHPIDGGSMVDIAVVAVPPRQVAEVLAQLQAVDAARVYTDLASVKVLPIQLANEVGCDMRSFVAGHPMAGGERSGPMSSRADLFLGRPWAYCPTATSSAEAVDAVLQLIELCGADAVESSAAEHDISVALVSHAPHVIAAAMAARLTDAPDATLRLAGTGVRDMTRIAAGDANLWTGILSSNATAVANVLDEVARDIIAAAVALRERGDGHESRHVTTLLDRGVRGTARIPGRHGRDNDALATVKVVINDQPGQLAKLFALAKKTGTNIEDVRLDHASGLLFGIAELAIRPDSVARLVEALNTDHWTVQEP